MELLMHHYLDKTAERLPEKTAIITDRQYSYAEFLQKVNALAGWLQSIGLERNDRVVVALGNTVETAISFWAVLKAGGVISPVEAGMKSDKMEYILKDSGAKVFITTTERQNDTISEWLTTTPLQNVLMVGEVSNQNGIVAFEEALGSEYKFKQPTILSVDLAMIIYTSGSTGEPKGVMHTHQTMVTATDSLNKYLTYREDDVILSALPLSFDYGLYQMVMSCSQGATLVVEKELTWPILFLKKINQLKVTVLPGVPTLISLLKRTNDRIKMDMPTVRSVTNTGAALTIQHIEAIKELFPNTQIFSMYGLTECKRCTYLPPEDIERKPLSVGIAIPNTELWLIDDDGNKVGPNEIGQLVIRGGTVMKGYWKKPEKTAEKLKDADIPGEKLLYTGDYCMQDDEGYLYFKGRMDQVIKSRGIKVSPKEVEDFIYTLDHVADVAAIGVPHPEFGEAIHAFVVAKPGNELSNDNLKRKCQDGLQRYQVPEHFTVLAEMPKTPNGKFNKLALKEMALPQPQAV